jgi:hypothetical protein
MYELVTGPLAWLAFGIFIFGLLYRLVWYIRGLNWQMDRVTYSAERGLRHQGRPALHLLLAGPLRHPQLAVLPRIHRPRVSSFTSACWSPPSSLMGHNVLLLERCGIQPAHPARRPGRHAMTAGRDRGGRVHRPCGASPCPRCAFITKPYDFLVLAIAVAPIFDRLYGLPPGGQLRLLDRRPCPVPARLMLVAIPFTKLSHFLLFFLSRAQLGMDYGIKRGGMKKQGHGLVGRATPHDRFDF